MTMPKAVLLLIASAAIMALGIALIFFKVEGGLVDSSINERNVGARIGDQRATPTGSGRNTFPVPPRTRVEDELATITAVVRTAQAGLTPTPLPSLTTAGIGGTAEYDGSRYTVLQVADPEPPGFFSTKDGFRRVALELRQEAVGKQVRYAFSNFKLRDSNGVDYTWSITNSQPRFETGTLEAGQTRQGWLSFELPAGAQPAALILQVFGLRDGVTLVTLR